MTIQNNVFIEITTLDVLKEVHEKLEQMFLGKKVLIEIDCDEFEDKYTVDVKDFILRELKVVEDCGLFVEDDNKIYLNHCGEDCDFIVHLAEDLIDDNAVSQIIFSDNSCTLITCDDKRRLSIV